MACLGYTGQLVEITATAVVPDTEAGSPNGTHGSDGTHGTYGPHGTDGSTGADA